MHPFCTCIKICSIVLAIKYKVLIIQLLDKCFSHNKIAPWLGTCVKGVQFYCPSRTYPAIPYYQNPSKNPSIAKYYLHILGSKWLIVKEYVRINSLVTKSKPCVCELRWLGRIIEDMLEEHKVEVVMYKFSVLKWVIH